MRVVGLGGEVVYVSLWMVVTGGPDGLSGDSSLSVPRAEIQYGAGFGGRSVDKCRILVLFFYGEKNQKHEGNRKETTKTI